ncbi:MAG: hypothetical protein Q4G38_02845 [Aeriscardovia aeriphila]|nr:hypothetical protein [Aeriscardovia aeriphila]
MSSIHSLSQHEPQNEKSTLRSLDGQPLQTAEEVNSNKSEVSSTVPAFSFTWNSSHTVMTALSLLIVGFFAIAFLTMTPWSANIFLSPAGWAGTCDLAIGAAVFSLLCGAIPNLSLSVIASSAAVNILALLAISTRNMLSTTAYSAGVTLNIFNSIGMAAGVAAVFFAFYTLSAITLRPLVLRWESHHPSSTGRKRDIPFYISGIVIVLVELMVVWAFLTDLFDPGQMPGTVLALTFLVPVPALIFGWLAIYPYSQLRWFVVCSAILNMGLDYALFVHNGQTMRAQDYAAVFAILIPYVLGAIAGTITKGIIMRHRARMEKKA